eukprot:710748-Rhodomonas_salina.2
MPGEETGELGSDQTTMDGGNEDGLCQWPRHSHIASPQPCVVSLDLPELEPLSLESWHGRLTTRVCRAALELNRTQQMAFISVACQSLSSLPIPRVAYPRPGSSLPVYRESRPAQTPALAGLLRI